MLWKRLRLTLDMIKFEHSVFALPFALTGALLAFRDGGYARGRNRRKAGLDRGGDGGRALCRDGVQPAGGCAHRRAQSAHQNAPSARRAASRGFGWALRGGGVGCSSSWPPRALNPLCLKLAPVALGIVFFYSFTKRFTSFSHLVLGFSLGIAPAAAWIAVRGSLDPRILWLTAAVTFWTAGFDVIYSCQDFEFDRAEGLFSVPRVLGIAGALRVAQALHVLMIVCLLALVYSLHLGALALAGVAAIVALLIYEHSLVKADDLSRVNAAFFTMNGYVSVLFLIFWAADIFLLKPGA